LNSLNLSTLAASALVTLGLSACGGGGGSAAGGGNTTSATGGTANTPTLDLKSADGSKNAASMILGNFGLAAFFSGGGSSFSTPSGTFEQPCSNGGKIIVTSVNTDGVASIGDSIKQEAVACTTVQNVGSVVNSDVTSSTSNYSVTSLTGNPAIETGQYSLGLGADLSYTGSTDQTYSGVRYVGTTSGNFSSTYSVVHDGKGTSLTNDDTNTVVSSFSGKGSGTINGVALTNNISFTGNCTFAADGSGICTKLDSTISGSSIFAGTVNLTSVVTTPIKLNANDAPIAGAINITQGSEVTRVTFSLSGTVPIATIVSAAGVTTTINVADLEAISDKFPF
jgi:hypothetical protein